MIESTDMISTEMAYQTFGLPRAALRSLAEREIIRCVDRQIDVCHTMRFYSRSDIARFIEQGAPVDA